MDKQLFAKICEEITGREQVQSGIGTLGEKTLHAVLKNYYELNAHNHEIKIDGYVADIFNGHEIIEIQTQSFNRLRKKLPVFLKQYPLTIVYPIPYIKWICWIDPESKKKTSPRKSPRKGNRYMIFSELYKIKNYLTMPNLRFKIVLLNIEEYRFLNGWSEDKKKGSTRCDRIPLEIVDEICISGQDDYRLLIPESLDKEFTSSDFRKASGLSKGASSIALNILNYVGSIERTGKKGRTFLYRRID